MCLCTWQSHHDLWWVFLVTHFFTSSSFGFLVALSVSWSALPHLSVTPKSCLPFQTQAENRREEQFLQKPKHRHHRRTSRVHYTYTEKNQQHPCTVLLKHCPKLQRLWFLSFWFGGLVHFKKCIVCLHAHHSTCVGNQNLQKSVASFHHVASGDWTQVIIAGDKCLYSMSHIASPAICHWWRKRRMQPTLSCQHTEEFPNLLETLTQAKPGFLAFTLNFRDSWSDRTELVALLKIPLV